ncbi:MAG: IS1182 family transposase [Chloroflexi bacterium]|nr:IS1182 family transposase [Chloroflexota bacterium]
MRCVSRDRVTAIPARLEDLLAADHLARLIWEAVARLDLAAFYAPIVVVIGGPGQAATDPQILVALWLYALSQGVTSARRLNDLCVEHLAYIWLCGGVSMNYHTLSDFRMQHLQTLDDLLTQVLACLDQAGLIAYEHTAQDGLRVRASAGAASFRREATLEKRLAEARAVVAALTAPLAAEAETAAPSARAQAAQERAATERVTRLEAALAELPAAQAAKPAAEQAEARVSTTDPQARVMKMADGGYRPAYNFEFATDTAHRVIVGVDVTNAGTDKAEMAPMLDQVQERTDRLPDDWLMDGGFVTLPAVDTGAAKGVRILAPVPQPKDPTRDPAQPLATDSPAVAAWRARMATAEAKATYQLRAATSECVNAQARSRHGLLQLRVRGLLKALAVALWIAITHDVLIWVRHLATARSSPLAA